MNRFKCPACGGNQYTSCSTAEGCIYCGHKELEKMEILEPDESEVREDG
jgi:predicted nucleic-acid-binding Zn-ribbon protein